MSTEDKDRLYRSACRAALHYSGFARVFPFDADTVAAMFKDEYADVADLVTFKEWLVCVHTLFTHRIDVFFGMKEPKAEIDSFIPDELIV